MIENFEVITIATGDTSAWFRLPKDDTLVWVTRWESTKSRFLLQRKEEVRFLAKRDGDVWRCWVDSKAIEFHDLWRYANEEIAETEEAEEGEEL